MSKTATVTWGHEDIDYVVTVKMSGGRKQTYGQPTEDATLEVLKIEVGGPDGGPPVSDEIAQTAQESDELYRSVMDHLSALYDDEDRGRRWKL